ncbi:hypothetical protein FXF51_45205 [Nonomuraea sp. PA05]|uniref:hypothetical protein n=1 Tax=Nonomuraea sp. PA05 TaxID=2604466 RepID=UPI0011DAA16B|nr:hypothetical protein [Nonomuraea sp. PA05]TYB56017.1 hypothetical protein FXF51_45205 [Nonomuraea sp. PA05]
MTGLLIGAVFGAVFVFVNTHDPLSGTAVLVLRVIAGLAAVAVLALWFTAARRERTGGAPQEPRAQPAPQEARTPTVPQGARTLPVPQEARTQRDGGGAPRGGMFGRGYVAVVVVEAIMLFGGLRVLAALEAPEQANVAWVALVVGVHFVVLAPIWKSWDIAVPGAVLTLLGIAGLVLAPTSVAAWVPILSGVLSGIVLLAGTVTVSWRSVAGRTP